MAGFELVIRGGEVVNADQQLRADVGISGGKIIKIGGDLSGRQEIDASGMLLFPGGIDAHVHLVSSLPPGYSGGPHWVDDFTSGSEAALAGGITTIGNMTSPRSGETPLAALKRETRDASQQAIADFFLHPIFSSTEPEFMDEIPELLEQGCNSLKFFMAGPQFDPQVAGYLEVTRRAGAAGLITLIHCEDYALMADAAARLELEGKVSLHHFPSSRPIIAEVVAAQRAVAFAEAVNSPVYIVHLSSKRALAVCAEAQARGVPVYAETRPLYLHLTAERFAEKDAGKYVGQPPLREKEDQEALWEGLRQGSIQTVCTDHAPWTLEAKLDPTLNITNLRPGVENLQTMLPMLFSEGVIPGKISLARLVEVTSTNASRLFGLYPQKGIIAEGSDADIVIFDPNLTRTVDRSMLKSRAGYSVYEGWEVTGWPVFTIRRGEVVFANEKVTGTPGSGKLISRGPTTGLKPDQRAAR